MILVTGAGGTVGTEVVKALKASGARFKAGVRGRRPEVGGVASVALDFDEPQTLGPALAGVDTLFLLSNLVTQESNAVAAAKAAGVGKIVKLSVWRAADEAYSFARWHRPVERAIEASGIAFTFLRCNLFMQNVVNHMGASIRKDDAFYLPAADARVAQIDVRDIAAVAAEALTTSAHDRKAYDLSGPQSLGFADVAQTLSNVLGREIRYVAVTPEDYKKGAVASGVPEPYADALLDLYRYYREGKAAEPTGAVRAVTGKDPIRFEQFARDHADALR